ncbi:MAG: heavy metal translocating P-type ATPase [Thermomicrobiales bacterium]
MSSNAAPDAQETWWDRWGQMASAAMTWVLLLAGAGIDHLTDLPHGLVLAAYIGAYITGGTLAAWTALNDLRHGQVNVDLLMVAAAIGAATVDAWAEGAVLLALFSTSGALEHAALERTRRAVEALMDLSPQTATLQRDGREVIVAVADLQIGDRVLVKPGDRVPVDGTVVDGRSEIDQAAITGESLPVTKNVGDPVFAGTINQRGALSIGVTRLSHESTLAKIIAFVEEAREQKSDTERFAEAFEGKYTVGVIVASAIVFFFPWAVLGHDAGDAFYRAMTLLVVASPCALVISTPATTLSALANAARNGILFKGGNYLEVAGSINTFAFDKTGTLTTGRQVLTDLVPVGHRVTEDELLSLAAGAERFSEHHVAVAVTEAAHIRDIPFAEVTDFEAHAGKGITAVANGRRIWIGNDAMAAEQGMEMCEAKKVAECLRNEGKSAVMIADECGPLGVLAVADTIRPEAKLAVHELRDAGVDHIIMLTGDNRRVAESIAEDLGIDDVRADLLPEEKLETITGLMAQNGKVRVAMIGDGVNDAPALATATLGIAMGNSGTDVALETADVVLMGDDLRKLPYALKLSRRARRTITQNLAFSLLVIVVLVTLALTIGIPLPVGVVGHEGSTIIVVLNGLRLLRTQR